MNPFKLRLALSALCGFTVGYALGFALGHLAR
jgi:hypothetical protein